jgi:opacity protein-like surface antigen
MIYTIRKTALACGVAGILTLAAAAPALAQVVVVDPYYGGPYGAYAGPYGGYGYSRGYRAYRDDYPAGYDTGGMPFSYRDLGWQPGPPGAAPANPCYPSQRAQNRC